MRTRPFSSSSRLDVVGDARRSRNLQPLSLQPFDMEANRGADFLFDGGNGRSGRHAAGKIRHISRIISLSLLDHDRVTHYRLSLRPACLKILLSVPGAKSSEGLPAIVTRPDLFGCRYCL